MANFSEIGEREQERVALAMGLALWGGKLKRIVAEETGRGLATVKECGIVGRITQPLDVILAALDLTGHPALLELLRTEKYEMRPMAKSDGQDRDPEKEAMDVVLSVSALVSTYRAAIDDGRMDADEARAILNHLNETDREVGELKDSLRRIIKE